MLWGEPWVDAARTAHQGVQLYNIQGGCSGISTQKQKKNYFNHESYKQFNQILEQPTKKKLKKKHSLAINVKLFAGAENIKYKIKEFSVFPVPKLPSSWLQMIRADKIRLMVVRRYQKGLYDGWLEESPRNQSYSFRKIKREKKNLYEHHFFGISASFFGEQEWEKLLEGWEE